MKETRIIIAEDHQIVRDGLKALLSSEPHLEVVAEAANGQELFDVLIETSADLILLDLNMPVISGLEAAIILTERHPEIHLLALTMLQDDKSITEALDAGIDGYLLKNTGRVEMIHAINEVMEGRAYFHPEITKTLAQGLMKSNQPSHEARLTPREVDVLRLIAQNKTSAQIANTLFISVNTVDSHRKNLHSKLQVNTAIELVKYAIQYGYLDE